VFESSPVYEPHGVERGFESLLLRYSVGFEQ